MIEVKNNRIYFYNTNKRDIIPVDFQCVSAYVCPHCKKVLVAYYGGKIVDLEPFMEEPAMKYLTLCMCMDNVESIRTFRIGS